MVYTTLLTTEELAARLDDPSWIVVDTRSSLLDPDAGRRAYETAHVPGAVFADLNRDLSIAPGGGRGRHPLPTVDEMARTFGALGIGPETQVVVYDDADGMYAARMWWMLRYVGHDAVAVLDGGMAKWQAEGRPTTSGREARTGLPFVAAPRREMAVTADEVEDARRDASRVVVDSRAPDRYRGENETIDPVGGHIPGARNRFFKLNVEADGAMRDPATITAEMAGVLGPVLADRAIFYCGSGVSACQNLLALEHAGLTGAKLYPGSWSEWISDPNRPIATGEEPS